MAALGVVLCHYCQALNISATLKNIFTFGQTGVYVFFLVSGFIIIYSLINSGYKTNMFFTFLLKRSLRIDPAYYITLIITLLFFKYLATISPVKTASFNFIPLQFLAHVTYVLPFTKYPFYAHVFWTLCVEFQFYLIIGSLYFLSGNFIFKTIFLLLFSLLGFANWPNGYYLVFNYAPIFAAGIALVSLYQDRNWLNASLVVIFLLFTERKFGIPVFVLLSTACLLILFLKQKIKPLSFLGDISYSLYLTHTLIFALLAIIQNKFHLTVSDYPLLLLFLETIIAIFFAYVFYMLIERPSLYYSKKIFYKKQLA
ncbi:acyltransferase [Inquilinus sp. KBS0705]|nr:acyltransferase [Inquilinus sp. KBS0705]